MPKRLIINYNLSINIKPRPVAGFFVCGGGFVFYKMINCKVMLNESKNTHSMIRYIFINGLN